MFVYAVGSVALSKLVMYGKIVNTFTGLLLVLLIVGYILLELAKTYHLVLFALGGAACFIIILIALIILKGE